MQCPYCGNDSSVTETRVVSDGLRRRRMCGTCKRRFTTYEKVGAASLRVQKRNGSVEPFDSEKLVRALARIGRRRANVQLEDARRIARDIEANLVDSGRTLELIREMYPKAHFATVYAKPKGRPMVQTYVTEVSQDTWIFFPWDMALQYVQPFRGAD